MGVGSSGGVNLRRSIPRRRNSGGWGAKLPGGGEVGTGGDSVCIPHVPNRVRGGKLAKRLGSLPKAPEERRLGKGWGGGRRFRFRFRFRQA